MSEKVSKLKEGKKLFIFEYEGNDKAGRRISSEITSRSLPYAKKTLAAQGITVLKIRRKPTSIFERKGKVRNSDITLFSRQVATMVQAGVPLVQSLSIIAEGTVNPAMASLVSKIRIDLETGSSFSVALRKYPKHFGELFCNLVAAGETAGALDTILERIAVYLEKSESLKRKIKKALYYPAAVVVIAAVVTVILLLKVVPTFRDMFKSFGAELPAFTQFVLNISDLLQQHGISVILGLGAIIGLLVYSYKKNQKFRHSLERLSLKVPVIGPLLQKSSVARFARTLATTTAAGVPITEALDSVAKATGNIVYVTAIRRIKEGLAMGQQINVAMKKTGVFPPMVVQMIAIGEESGALEKMLTKIANIYEEEVDVAVDGLTTLLEPFIMIILGIIVGGLVIAMYLPIFKMGSII